MNVEMSVWLSVIWFFGGCEVEEEGEVRVR